jgi:hypothetical protein
MFIKVRDDKGKKILLYDESLPNAATVQKTERINLLKAKPICGSYIFIVNTLHATTKGSHQMQVPTVIQSVLKNSRIFSQHPHPCHLKELVTTLYPS